MTDNSYDVMQVAARRVGPGWCWMAMVIRGVGKQIIEALIHVQEKEISPVIMDGGPEEDNIVSMIGDTRRR